VNESRPSSISLMIVDTPSLCRPYALPTDLLCAQAQLHAVACDKLARRANQWKPV